MSPWIFAFAVVFGKAALKIHGLTNLTLACLIILQHVQKVFLAPRVGLEPTTQRLTAACSTN